jgi:hypothetical protein
MENINTSEIFETISNELEQLKTAVIIKDDKIATLEKEITGLIDTIKCSTYSAAQTRISLLEQIKTKKLNHANFGEIVTIADIENIINMLNEEV